MRPFQSPKRIKISNIFHGYGTPASAAAAAAFVQKFVIIYGAVSARRNFFFFRPYRIRITLSYGRVLYRQCALCFSIPHRQSNPSVFVIRASLPEHPSPSSRGEQEIQSFITLDFYRERFLSRRWTRWYSFCTYLLRAPRASTSQSGVIELAPDIIAL